MAQELGTNVSGANVSDGQTRQAFSEQEQINHQLVQRVVSAEAQIQTLKQQLTRITEALGLLSADVAILQGLHV